MHYHLFFKILKGTVNQVQRGLGKTGQLDRARNGTPLQYSCLENPMDGGAW